MTCAIYWRESRGKRGSDRAWSSADLIADSDLLPLSSPLSWLRRMFGLTPFDLDVVLLAFAPELDLRYEKTDGHLWIRRYAKVRNRRPRSQSLLRNCGRKACATPPFHG